MVNYMVSVSFLLFFWCPCMAVNVVSIQYNGGLLPDTILLTQCYFHRGTRLNAMRLFFVFAALDPTSKRFDIFSPLTGGCSEGLGAF